MELTKSKQQSKEQERVIVQLGDRAGELEGKLEEQRQEAAALLEGSRVLQAECSQQATLAELAAREREALSAQVREQDAAQHALEQSALEARQRLQEVVPQLRSAQQEVHSLKAGLAAAEEARAKSEAVVAAASAAAEAASSAATSAVVAGGSGGLSDFAQPYYPGGPGQAAARPDHAAELEQLRVELRAEHAAEMARERGEMARENLALRSHLGEARATAAEQAAAASKRESLRREAEDRAARAEAQRQKLEAEKQQAEKQLQEAERARAREQQEAELARRLAHRAQAQAQAQANRLEQRVSAERAKFARAASYAPPPPEPVRMAPQPMPTAELRMGGLPAVVSGEPAASGGGGGVRRQHGSTPGWAGAGEGSAVAVAWRCSDDVATTRKPRMSSSRRMASQRAPPRAGDWKAPAQPFAPLEVWAERGGTPWRANPGTNWVQ